MRLEHETCKVHGLRAKGSHQPLMRQAPGAQVHARLVQGHKGAVTALLALPSREPGGPDALVSAGADGTIAVWEPSANNSADANRCRRLQPGSRPGADLKPLLGADMVQRLLPAHQLYPELPLSRAEQHDMSCDVQGSFAQDRLQGPRWAGAVCHPEPCPHWSS